MKAVARAFAELARLIRLFRIGGRRIDSFAIEQTWQWLPRAHNPVAYYRRDSGRVFPMVPGTPVMVADVRLLRRAERRKLVGIKRWRAGDRAPQRMPSP